ncbi:MAG: hypothetical protein ACI9MC_003145 [Kiritimatiellia bacterium]|jgi:hypothetical protein
MGPNLLVFALIPMSNQILVSAIAHDGEDVYVADWPDDTVNEAKAVAGALGGHSAYVDDPLDGSRVAKQLIFERATELPTAPLSQLGEHPRDGVITDHYDGYGLNDIILIAADARDTEDGGNASHHYVAMMPSTCMVEDPETGEMFPVQDIVARIDFQHGPLGWMMDQVMVESTMDKMVGVVLAGLAHYVVTGDVIGQDFDPGALKATTTSSAAAQRA